MTTKFLVLGGTSFLGTHLIENIYREYDVTATYLTRRPSLEVCHYRRCNLLSKADLFSLGQFQVVVLYSAVVSGQSKLDTNLEFVRNTIEFCNNTDALFIYISSSQVHFSQPSEYKQSKLLSEELIVNNSKRFHIIRPAAPYGPVPRIETTRSQPFHILTNTIKNFPVVPIIGD